jgi:hypothetical protein
MVSPKQDPYPHTDEGAQVRRIFHLLRHRAIENLNEHFKALFDAHGSVPTKGEADTARFALGAVFVYQLALLHRYHKRHLDTNVGHWARIASVMTSESLSRAGRPVFGGSEEHPSFHQSSTSTYDEIKKESRSMAAPSFGESLVQHKVWAPSPLPRVTHHSSEKFIPEVAQPRSG